MPEGHTIHRLARDQTELLTGRALEVSSPQGRFSAGAARIDGAVLTSVEAYGKHLFHWWETGEVGHVHLGLFGRFRTVIGDTPPAPAGAVRMRLHAPGHATVDLSGPTACSLGPADERDAIIARLGPDPLRPDADPDRATAAIARRSLAIGALLLDQSVISGVGNVYRAEALFLLGIHPGRRGRDCAAQELDSLWDVVRSLLRRGVDDGAIITVDASELEPGGSRRPRRGETTYVYHRTSCRRCGTAVATIELGGRPCWFCPSCQPR